MAGKKSVRAFFTYDKPVTESTRNTVDILKKIIITALRPAP